MPTDFFRWERDASLTCQNVRKVLFLRKEKGVITHLCILIVGNLLTCFTGVKMILSLKNGIMGKWID